MILVGLPELFNDSLQAHIIGVVLIDVRHDKFLLGGFKATRDFLELWCCLTFARGFQSVDAGLTSGLLLNFRLGVKGKLVEIAAFLM